MCREAGYPPEGAVATTRSAYGLAGPYWISDVACTTGSRLIDCLTATSWNSAAAQSCAASRAAGVRCERSVRFSQAASASSGRVEAYLASLDLWSPIGADYFSGIERRSTSAQVLCRAMGLPTTGAQLHREYQGSTYLRTVISALASCTGAERSPVECSNFYTTGTYHSNVVSVFCPLGARAPPWA